MSTLKIGRLTACSAVLLFAGCSGGGVGEGDRKDVYPVTGKITMNGGAVAGATVTFSPKEGQPVAYGRTNSSGEYALTTYDANDGAAEGEYVVLVAKNVGSSQAVSEQDVHEAMAQGQAAPMGGHGGASGGDAEEDGSLLPTKYSSQLESDLKATVTTDSDKNRFDFELKP